MKKIDEHAARHETAAVTPETNAAAGAPKASRMRSKTTER